MITEPPPSIDQRVVLPKWPRACKSVNKAWDSYVSFVAYCKAQNTSNIYKRRKDSLLGPNRAAGCASADRESRRTRCTSAWCRGDDGNLRGSRRRNVT